MRISGKGPLVSIVVPAFNAEATLVETLQTISAQTHSHIEILVVDDGSSDLTAELAHRYCMIEPRARLIRKANGGVASARNRGIQEAKGAWIAPVDADDLWHPTKLEAQLQAAAVSKQPVGFVYCWSRFIDQDGRVVGCPRHWTASGHVLLQLALRNFVGNGSALLLSRDALSQAGGYDEGLRAAGAQGCEDLLLQVRIASRYLVASVPEHLVGYRLGHAAMSDDYPQMDRSWELVFDALTREMPASLPRLSRWARAAHARGMVAAAARNGDILVAGAFVAKALRLDPHRMGVYLLSRAKDVLRRPRGRGSSPVHFSSVQPTECCTNHEGPVERLEARRLLRLARQEALIRQRRRAR